MPADLRRRLLALETIKARRTHAGLFALDAAPEPVRALFASDEEHATELAAWQAHRIAAVAAGRRVFNDEDFLG